ncbi:MAG TPA: hypothetical protein VHX65_18460 [Pirellulales bacterium]|jgi:hypothetical protein|nr:hypothetical protein [Pirellulales bacterium]
MSLFARVIGIALLGGAFLAGSSLMTSKTLPITAPAAQAAEEHHPAIHRALKELREARHELKDAKHDFGGHREDALKAVDGAIEQLEICLKHG